MSYSQLPCLASWENICWLFFKPALTALCFNALSQFFIQAIIFSRSLWIQTHLDLGKPPSFIFALHLLSHASTFCERVHDLQGLRLQVPSAFRNPRDPWLPAALGDLRLILQHWVSTKNFHPKTGNRCKHLERGNRARATVWAGSSPRGWANPSALFLASPVAAGLF